MSHALRQREIKVNSPHGLRAKEIASLTWDMATNSGGEIGTGVHLTNEAGKGRGGGRIIRGLNAFGAGLKAHFND